jgi:hypothetical protein
VLFEPFSAIRRFTSLRGALISGLPEIGIIARKSGKPDLRATTRRCSLRELWRA